MIYIHGLVEIKYPHSLAEKNVTDLEDTKSFFLGINDNGVLMVKRDHQYYYQGQSQLALCEKKYCVFVVWGGGEGFVYIESFVPDNEFWESCVSKSSSFYIKGILPELLAKWFAIHSKAKNASSKNLM